AELARELVNAAASRSYTVLIEHTASSAQRERQLFFGAASQLIDGVILSPAGLTADEVRGLFGRKPLVLLGERISDHVADHVAVVGIDDIEEGHFSVPTLTTISPNKRQIAEIALELLIAQIQGAVGERQPQEVDASFELIVRESTAGRAAAR